ncbi:BQ2448_1311 [Microbotryum intermedium]|uniref:BQ2448_1311 protein n=1 Tax=Microbotryum intermedium TaxID=269621 RepID=A0A238F9U1_9BASI|nr:BQ2448_1311 [Microbotryum intermedium]
MASSDRTIHQPIEPSVLPLMDPQYVAFHNEHVIYMPKTEDAPYSPSLRIASSKGLMSGSSHIRKVAKTQEFVIGRENITVRASTPLGEVPEAGWPVLLWFHGGGWVLGGINSGNHLCTAMTQDAKCVTITVDYRLAPEHLWPAAVDDAVGGSWAKAALNSTWTPLGLPPAAFLRGNLSAVLCTKLSPPIKICFQMLTTPAIDSSIKEYTVNTNAPWLSPGRMLWYRRLYLPNESDWTHPDASPNYAPDEELARVPKSFIAVAGQEILAPEALQYAEKLKRLGVEVETWVVEGATHSVVNLEDVMDSAKDLIRREGEALNKVFHS